MKYCGIYMIVNLLNNKYYIGSAINIQNRWWVHTSDLNRNSHINKHLQRAWNQYGKENFKFKIIEKLDDKERLIEREQFWIELYNATDINLGYNIRPNAQSNLGIKWSDEYKKKMSERTKGRIFSKEHKFNHAIAMHQKQYKHSEETKLKLSKAAKNRKVQPRLGKTFTPEQRLKMSASLKAFYKKKESLNAII